MVLNLDGKDVKLSLGEKILLSIIVIFVTLFIGYFVWVIGDSIYRHYNPIEWTATIEELESGIYGYTSTMVSNVSAENYEMLTVLCNGTYMNIKGHVKIVYDSNAPYIEYKSTNTVNADSVIIHVQKGQIKNNGVSTVTR
nr:MAG TPA: hypothetical protein [Caudoviricetes sp.]